VQVANIGREEHFDKENGQGM